MQGKGAPTLSDVADRAGVNRVTVSVVLNNNARANTKVSETTRQRILAAAAELRYQPNAVARSLQRRRTDTIGFYSGNSYNDAANPFISQLLSGLQKGCKQYGKDLLLHSRSGAESADAVYAELANGKVDGLVLYVRPDDPLVADLARSHLPVVAIADVVPGLPSVVVDDAAGGRLQAEHLAGMGHRHVFYQSIAQDLTSVRRREAAFCAAAAARGMTVRMGYADSIAGGLSETLEGATAIVGWEDLCAYRVLSACLAMGRRIPQDVAIVGFDGVALPVEPLWRLTTIRAPWREVARTAVSVLVSQLAGEDVPEETVLPVELVAGNTT